jgi:hypothetical protein
MMKQPGALPRTNVISAAQDHRPSILLSLFSTLLCHKEPLRHVKGVSGVTSIPDVIGRGCALRLRAITGRPRCNKDRSKLASQARCNPFLCAPGPR